MPVVGHGADLDGAPLACTLREREGRHCQRTRFVILDTGLLWSRAVITFRFLLLTYLCHSLLLVVMGVKYGLWRRVYSACTRAELRAAEVGSRGENPDNARAILPFTKRHAGGRAKG